MNRIVILLVAIGVVSLGGMALVAVYWWKPSTPPPIVKGKPPVYPDAEFKDDVSTNAEYSRDQFKLEFRDREGKSVQIGNYLGKKAVVLVFLRGYTKTPGGFCPSCNAQTSRLIANHAEFTKRDAEVLVVFPGAKDHIGEFVKYHHQYPKEQTVPFPILADEDFKVSEKLGLLDDRVKPSTFIIDKEGQLRLAYVGATTADRPSLVALYKVLDSLSPEKKGS